MDIHTGVQPLEQTTRKKLILVKQIYQRALAQSQASHSSVDRLLALIGFDLAIETLLKTIVDALERNDKSERTFPAVVDQVQKALTKYSLPNPRTKDIYHVHNLRNDAQHRASYPSETELSDCRTYTRDFLGELCSTIWDQSFDSISLIDTINDERAKELLTDAEKDLLSNRPGDVVIKALVAFKTMLGDLANTFTAPIGYHVNGIVVTENFKKPEASQDVLRAFMRTRELLVFQTLGISLQEYLRFRRFTRFVGVSIAKKDTYKARFSGPMPTLEEAEYILNFVINTVLLVESLDPSVSKPFDRLN